MRILKTNPLFKVINHLVIDSPLPGNINYFWNYGSLLGLNLIIMIITGVTLAMHYTPHVDLAFLSVEHIMRDVNSGWLLRFIHANGASVFFILVFIHMARGLYYGSYRAPRTGLWLTGVTIFVLMITIAFLGYTLVYGQMSFWGVTVITNLFSVIPWGGTEIVKLLLGGPSVVNATLNRFFSLHYVLPFVLTGIIILHIYFLNLKGSNNPLGINANSDKFRFHPYFTIKDLVGFILLGIFYIILVFYYPYYLNHPDNSIPANPMVTPAHITPEWYLLPFYAILRSIPSKLGGVIAMASAMLILFLLPIFTTINVRSNKFKPLLEILFWVFVFNFILLVILGGSPIEQPYIFIGQICSSIYFIYFLILFLVG